MIFSSSFGLRGHGVGCVLFPVRAFCVLYIIVEACTLCRFERRGIFGGAVPSR